MESSSIYLLDVEGNITELCSYSLEPKAALIAHYMQYIEYNFNTADYPADCSALIRRPSGKGWSYFRGDDTFFSGPSDMSLEPVYETQSYEVHYDMDNVTVLVNVYHTDKTELTKEEILQEAEGYLDEKRIPANNDDFAELVTLEKVLAKNTL